MGKKHSLLNRLLNTNKCYSFEIVSTKEEGIRYLIRINQRDSDLIRKGLLSYLPGIQINEVKDYLPIDKSLCRVTEFKLSSHFAFPLKRQGMLEEYDPIAYITGNMTKLSGSEIMAVQIIISPLNKSKIPDIKRISKLIYTNKDLLINLRQIHSDHFPVSIFKQGLFYLLHILFLPVGLFVFLASDGRESPFLSLSFNNPAKKINNAYQEELETLVKEKLDSELFSSSLRLLVIGENYSDIRRREQGFISALSTFGNSSYQSLVTYLNARFDLVQRLKYFTFKNRLLSLYNNLILSTSEVSDIYHFPFTSTTKTENLEKLQSRQLPAPLSLKKEQRLDVYFANNIYGGSTTPIGLSKDERRRHIYIIGATGTGKSTMLFSMINQDIKNGKGIAVLDPHGDLIEKIMLSIPQNRIKDVVYFNPDDIGFPIGLNMLELPKDLSDDELLREKEYIAESVISLFHKLYPEKYSGPRMEYILRNTIHTAFTTPNPTLFTISKLLTNTKYRNSVVHELKDENLKDFWEYEFNKAGDYQKVQMILPITNKIGRFLFSPTAKRILEQEKSTINFNEIIDSGKILLCNLSKGRLGEDTSEVFGILILTKLQLAALKRARVKMEERKDFYLYVDEFQNFATPSFAQILSEARKYRLNAVLAHQTTSQLEDKSLVNITLANTGTVICFRTANPEDERLILPQFKPYIKEGEIASLPSFNFYMKINAIESEEPFSGVTIPIEIVPNQERENEIIQESRNNYATKYIKQIETVKTEDTKTTRYKKTIKQDKEARQKTSVLP
jgi:hypothetical protein